MSTCQWTCGQLEQRQFELTYFPELESVGVNISERMRLLLLDRFLEVTDGLGIRYVEGECMLRIIALNPTEEMKCGRHSGRNGEFSLDASG
jgi:hypothetical protein